MTQQWGHVIADGSAAEIALVRLALDECVNLPSPLEDLLPKDYRIAFKTPAEMVAAKAIIPGSKRPSRPEGTAAEGFVKSASVLWVNAKIAAKQPARARHIVRHEIAHIMPLTDAKRAELMLLMVDEAGTHPTVWRGSGYEARPSECSADTFAEAISGKDSPWDDFDFFDLDVTDADVPKFIEIYLRPTADPPHPEPPPDPLPPDPLALKVTELEARLRAVAEFAKSKAEGTGGG